MVFKCNAIVVNFCDELPDDVVRVHVALSLHCSEVPQLRECAIVEFIGTHQYGNPVLDVRYPMRGGAWARRESVPCYHVHWPLTNAVPPDVRHSSIGRGDAGWR